MACKVPSHNLLDLEFSFLKQKFPKSHKFFVLRSHSEEEACLQFVLPDNTKVRFQVNFLHGYPKVKPLWTVDQSDVQSLDIELNLNDNDNDTQCPLVSKSAFLVNKLCTEYNIELPQEVQGMVKEFCDLYKPSYQVDLNSSDTIGEDFDHDDDDEYYNDNDDDFEDYTKFDDVTDFFPEDDVSNQADWNDRDGTGIDAGISAENRDFLEKMRIQSYKTTTTEEEKKDPTNLASAIASDRLLKELRDIYKSQAYKDKIYNVSIEEDNLYSWVIELFKVDTDSALHKDLMKLAEKNKENSIRIHVTFTATYPYEPPFVRILSPALHGGFVFPSGALCMELLTPQGWSSAYSLESVILQVSATMCKGGARVNFDSDSSLLSMHSAQSDFKMIISCHKEGWDTPPPNEG